MIEPHDVQWETSSHDYGNIITVRGTYGGLTCKQSISRGEAAPQDAIDELKALILHELRQATGPETPTPLDHLSQGEISELVNMVQALERRLHELGVVDYIRISDTEVHRGNNCSPSSSAQLEIFDD